MWDAIFQMPDSGGGKKEDKERKTETRREGTVDGRIGNAEGGTIRENAVLLARLFSIVNMFSCSEHKGYKQIPQSA